MSESVPGNPSHEPAETDNPDKNDDDGELHSDQLQGVPDWLQEFKHGLWMKVFQNIETLPVLLMNYLWSREQKWCRVSIGFFSLPEESKLRLLLENQDYKGFLLKTCWYSRAQTGKFW